MGLSFNSKSQFLGLRTYEPRYERTNLQIYQDD